MIKKIYLYTAISKDAFECTMKKEDILLSLFLTFVVGKVAGHGGYKWTRALVKAAVQVQPRSRK